MILKGQSWQIKFIKKNLDEQSQKDPLKRTISNEQSQEDTLSRKIISSKQVWHDNFDKAIQS